MKDFLDELKKMTAKDYLAVLGLFILGYITIVSLLIFGSVL